MATHRGTGIGGDSWRWSSHGLGADRGGRSSGAAPPAASNGPRLGSSLEGRLGRPGGAVGRWRRGAGNGPAQRSLRCSIGASGCFGMGRLQQHARREGALCSDNPFHAVVIVSPRATVAYYLLRDRMAA